MRRQTDAPIDFIKTADIFHAAIVTRVPVAGMTFRHLAIKNSQLVRLGDGKNMTRFPKRRQFLFTDAEANRGGRNGCAVPL